MPSQGAVQARKVFRSASLWGGLLFASICACYWVIWTRCLAQTQGHFTYALDDPYIHLAIAKNLAFHGVWGVTEYTPSSASSSPLWILLLAPAIRVFGDSIYWPLLFGIFFSLATVLLLYVRFVRAGFVAPLAFVVVAAIFALGPLHILPFTGMEHSLQILLDLAFGFWLLTAFARPCSTKELWIGLAITALMCLCRYESAFLIVVPFLAALWRRDWKVVGVLVLGPVLAVGGFGLYSHFAGMPPVPNSVVLKGNHPGSIAALLSRTYRFLHSESLALSDLFVLTVLAGVALGVSGLREKTRSLQVWLWTVVAASLLHAALALVGYFYRYEAYLLVLLATVLALAVRELYLFSWPAAVAPVSKRGWWITIGLACIAQVVLTPVFWFYQLGANLIVATYVLIFIAFVVMDRGARTRGRLTRVLLGCFATLALCFTVRDRSVAAFHDIANGSRDIYLQQFQMSRFVSRYYPKGRLAANDIGCVSYFTNVHLLDLVGLANDDIRALKRSHTFSTRSLGDVIDRFKPDLVIAYPDWFVGPESLPQTLIPVARWVIPPVTTAAGSMVTFYAFTAEGASGMRTNLVDFQSSLPSLVKVEYVGDSR